MTEPPLDGALMFDLEGATNEALNNRMDLAQTAQVFRDTATELRDNGWVQGCLQNPDGHCTVGGLMQVTSFSGELSVRSEDWDMDEWYRRAGRVQPYIDVLCAAVEEGVEDWNDEEGRTIEDVVFLLDSMAELMDQLAREET